MKSILKNYQANISRIKKIQPTKFFAIENYHSTKRNDNQLIIGGLALAATGVSFQFLLKLYNSKPKPQENANTEDSQKSETKKDKNKPNTNPIDSFFATWFSKNFYDGGFEPKMTKREAALILGVRESATEKRIKDSHRRILLQNHPDKGGSAYLAAKVNEAKDLLLKGK